MKISVILPYKENFSPTYPGAVSLFLKDTIPLSKFKKNIKVYGYTNSSSSIQGAMRSHWHFLDSSVGGDGSTAITYKVQVANYTTSTVRYSQDGNLSSITLMEVAA